MFKSFIPLCSIVALLLGTGSAAADHGVGLGEDCKVSADRLFADDSTSPVNCGETGEGLNRSAEIPFDRVVEALELSP